MLQELTNTENYLLHYIGSGLYGIKRFINESKRLDAQRAIPFRMLRNVEWGQPILLAEYQKVSDKKLIVEYEGTPLNVETETPTAVIFGYFTIDNLSFKLSDDVKKAYLPYLRIVDTISYEKPEQEDRACGSYCVGGCVYVENTIQEITTAISKACAETGHSVNDFKYFLKGKVRRFEEPIIIYNKKFNRGYSKIELPRNDINSVIKFDKQKPKQGLFFLYDYSKRSYLRKQQAEQIDKILVDEYKTVIKH